MYSRGRDKLQGLSFGDLSASTQTNIPAANFVANQRATTFPSPVALTQSSQVFSEPDRTPRTTPINCTFELRNISTSHFTFEYPVKASASIEKSEDRIHARQRRFQFEMSQNGQTANGRPSSPKNTIINPDYVASPQPEFGRITALGVPPPPLNHTQPGSRYVAPLNSRHVAGNDSNLFTKHRPKATEYHRPPTGSNPLQQLNKPLSVQNATSQPSRQGSNHGSSNEQNPHIAMTHKPVSDDVFIIPKPQDFPTRPLLPPQPQTFSSHTNSNPFLKPRMNFVDLTTSASTHNKEEDIFSDKHVFGNDRFGTNDPYMYIDSGKANENIKALLEGAMDDEEDKPRTRKRTKALSKKVDDLTKKVEAIAVPGTNVAESDTEEDEDDGMREGLEVKLLPHQIEGVEWMLNKELGTKKVKGILPKGGILADDMGLGKTIQSIALMLLNQRPSAEELSKSKRKLDPKTGKTTLVVAPLALIKQWEGELKDRVSRSHQLRVRIHHGPQRTKSFKDLQEYDVVITTYQTLSSEHDEANSSVKSALFGVNWYRIILDEAHSIKNRNAKSTKAACALNAEYRWCLSGTPMQNNLDELQSLIHFLRIKPYDTLEIWREQITKPMNNGRGGLSIRRLRTFLSAFMKRRTKDVLKQDGGLKTNVNSTSDSTKSGFQIVKRTVESTEVDFSPQEREIYQRLEARTDKRLEMMMAGNKLSYANALVLLMRLRQACNHPRLLKGDLAQEQDLGSRTPSRKTSKADDMDDIANMLGGLSVEARNCDICQIELSQHAIKEGLLRCDECEEDLRLQDVILRKQKEKQAKKEIKKQKKVNRRLVLDSDDEDDTTIAKAIDAGSKDDVADTSEDDYDEESSSDDSDQQEQNIMSSTKIRHLIKILKHDSHSNKYIVFSFFTSMLDLIEPFMDRHKLNYVRYDGAMRNDAREAALDKLRNDPTVRVMLCSLRAGSLGLNLTAASRVVVLEPFWNPFVEEQAIDRVHRLNQTQDVVVHKLTIKDTVEARILELQEKKRMLANATIEGQLSAGVKLSLQEMLKLFKHDAGHDMKLDMIGMKDPGALLDRGESTNSPSSAQHELKVRDQVKKPGRKEDPVYGRRW